MAVKVGLIFEDLQSRTALSTQLRKLLKSVCAEVLRQEGKDGLFEIGITFVDDQQIRRMNREFRDIDSPTDVLSFPLSQDGVTFDVNEDTGAFLLGDIVISLERAAEQAAEYGHSFRRETAFLVAHSMLHLLGYDHDENANVPPEKAGQAMRAREEAVLGKLGISRGEEVTADE